MNDVEKPVTSSKQRRDAAVITSEGLLSISLKGRKSREHGRISG